MNRGDSITGGWDMDNKKSGKVNLTAIIQNINKCRLFNHTCFLSMQIVPSLTAANIDYSLGYLILPDCPLPHFLPCNFLSI